MNSYNYLILGHTPCDNDLSDITVYQNFPNYHVIM